MLPERKKFRVDLIFPYKKYLSKAKLKKICDRFYIWYSLRARTFFWLFNSFLKIIYPQTPPPSPTWLVCYLAVFSVVTQRSFPLGTLRDDTKNGCVADYYMIDSVRNLKGAWTSKNTWQSTGRRVLLLGGFGLNTFRTRTTNQAIKETGEIMLAVTKTLSLFRWLLSGGYVKPLALSPLSLHISWKWTLIKNRWHCSKLLVGNVGPGVMVSLWLVLSLVWVGVVRSNKDWMPCIVGL